MYYLSACRSGDAMPDVYIDEAVVKKAAAKQLQERGFLATRLPASTGTSPAKAATVGQRRRAPPKPAPAVRQSASPPQELDAVQQGLERAFKCGLCEATFRCVKATTVTRKALQDVRLHFAAKREAEGSPTAPATRSMSAVATRGVTATIDAGTARVAIAQLYKQAPICRFCSQFFGVHYGQQFTADAPPAAKARSVAPATHASPLATRRSAGAQAVSVFPSRTRTDVDPSATPYMSGRPRPARLNEIELAAESAPLHAVDAASSGDYSDSYSSDYSSEQSSSRDASSQRSSRSGSPDDVSSVRSAGGASPARASAARHQGRRQRVGRTDAAAALPGRPSYRTLMKARTIPLCDVLPAVRRRPAAGARRGAQHREQSPRHASARDALGLELSDDSKGRVTVKSTTARAQDADIQPGDVVVCIGAVAASSVATADAICSRLKPCAPVHVVVRRNDDAAAEASNSDSDVDSRDGELDRYVMVAPVDSGAADELSLADTPRGQGDDADRQPVASSSAVARKPRRSTAPIAPRTSVTLVVVARDSEQPALPGYVDACVVPLIERWSTLAGDDECIVVDAASDALQAIDDAVDTDEDDTPQFINVFLLGHCAFDGAGDASLGMRCGDQHLAVSEVLARAGRGGTRAATVVVDTGSVVAVPTACGGKSVAVIAPAPGAPQRYPLGSVVLAALAGAFASGIKMPPPVALIVGAEGREQDDGIAVAFDHAMESLVSCDPPLSERRLDAAAAAAAMKTALSAKTATAAGVACKSAQFLRAPSGDDAADGRLPLVVVFDASAAAVGDAAWKRVASALQRRRCPTSQLHFTLTAAGPAAVIAPDTPQRYADAAGRNGAGAGAESAFLAILEDFAAGHLASVAGLRVKACGLLHVADADDAAARAWCAALRSHLKPLKRGAAASRPPRRVETPSSGVNQVLLDCA